MTDEHRQLDPVERSLLELEALERAGVLDRTTVPAVGSEELPRAVSDADGRPAPPLLRLGRRWWPIAASVAAAFGVWGWMTLSPEPGGGEGTPASRPIAVTAAPGASTGFSLDCLTGPGAGASERCRSSDLDTDGQITLADVGRMQLALASAAP